MKHTSEVRPATRSSKSRRAANARWRTCSWSRASSRPRGALATTPHRRSTGNTSASRLMSSGRRRAASASGSERRCEVSVSMRASRALKGTDSRS